MQFPNEGFPFGRFVASALALVVLVGNASAEVPEPQGYWTGPMHSEVPEKLSGARVLDSKTLAGLLEQGEAALIDTAGAPRRPETLAPGAVWKPMPHKNIPGSVWMPGIGEAALAPELESYFRERLRRLAANDLGGTIVFYCHPNCWASWNAAKRALSYGYRNIGWYREGAEGWQDAGHPLATAEPEAPPQTGH